MSITPQPADAQYTTSPVDLFLGNERLFKPKGVHAELNLAEQQFSLARIGLVVQLTSPTIHAGFELSGEESMVRWFWSGSRRRGVPS